MNSLRAGTAVGGEVRRAAVVERARELQVAVVRRRRVRAARARTGCRPRAASARSASRRSPARPSRCASRAAASSAATDTVSSKLPTSRLSASSSRSPMLTSTPSRAAFLKPGELHRDLVGAWREVGKRDSRRRCRSSPSRRRWWRRWWRSPSTPGNRPPWASVTRPVMAPRKVLRVSRWRADQKCECKRGETHIPSHGSSPLDTWTRREDCDMGVRALRAATVGKVILRSSAASKRPGGYSRGLTTRAKGRTAPYRGRMKSIARARDQPSRYSSMR